VGALKIVLAHFRNRMTTSFWQHTHQRERTTYDVVVVGGGIIGCSTAYWLSQREPSLDVAIVEALTLGAGASGRNAGFLIQGTDVDFLADIDRYGKRTARHLWAFTRDNRDLIASELRKSAFGWRADGALTVATTPQENERLQGCVPPLRAAGAPVVHLDVEKTNARLQSVGYHGGLFVTSGATVDPLRLVHHIAEQSRADLRTQQRVDAVQSEGRGVRVDTTSLQLRAEQVVLAVGASLPSLVPALSEYVRPVRAQMLATAPADTHHVSLPVYTHGGKFYIRQVNDRSVLAGGGRQSHREAEVTDTDTTTPAVQAAIERHLHRHFPWTQSLAVRQRWSGIMAFSPDGRPVVGRVPELPGSFFVTGCTGHGLGYGFRLGRLVADLVGGTPRPDGIELFAASRFPDDNPDPTEETLHSRTENQHYSSS